MNNITLKQYVYVDPQKMGARVSGSIIFVLTILCIRELFTSDFESVYDFIAFVFMILVFIFILKLSVDSQFPTYINEHGIFFKRNFIQKKILWENMDNIKVRLTTFDGRDAFEIIFYDGLPSSPNYWDCIIEKGVSYKELFEVIDEYAPKYNIKILFTEKKDDEPVVLKTMPKKLNFP